MIMCACFTNHSAHQSVSEVGLLQPWLKSHAAEHLGTPSPHHYIVVQVAKNNTDNRCK